MRRWLIVLLLLAAFIFGVLVPPVRYIGTAAPGDTLPRHFDISHTKNLPVNGADIPGNFPGERVLAQLSGVNISSVDFQPGGDGYVERVTIRYADGAILEYDRLDTTPPSATPTPTTPATATASSTPGTPTIAPIYTATATPALDATPTRESTPLPTATPAPTAIPKVCELRAFYTINIRDAVSGTWVGSWSAGEYRTFDQFVLFPGGYLWGHSNTAPAGWTVVFNEADLTASAWWVSGTATSGTCYEVEGWPSHVMPPEPFAREIRAGPHILMGEGASVVQNYAAEISAAKCLPGSYQICLAMKAVNPDMLIIARSFTDCPQVWQYDTPAAYWDVQRRALPQGFDAYEIENECSPVDDALWPKWANFSIQMAQFVERDMHAPMLAFSFGPGHPAFERWPDLLSYLRWVAANPLPDGRYHGIAIHASPYATFSRSDMPWVNNVWIAGRIYMARDVLLANTGFDLATWPGMIAVTEVGLSDGYSGNWNAPYNCAEVADAFKTTRATYQEQGYPQVLIHWNFGEIGMWTSDHDCAWAMFG